MNLPKKIFEKVNLLIDEYSSLNSTDIRDFKRGWEYKDLQYVMLHSSQHKDFSWIWSEIF